MGSETPPSLIISVPNSDVTEIQIDNYRNPLTGCYVIIMFGTSSNHYSPTIGTASSNLNLIA